MQKAAVLMIPFPGSDELLEICKTKVAHIFGQPEYSNWVNNDFILLSEDILEKTKIYLSPSSLKRIFGKISSDASPKKTTLDILAQYTGYVNWQDFTKQHSSSIKHDAPAMSGIATHPTTAAQKKNYKIFLWIIVAIGLITASVYYFYSLNSSSNQFVFTQIKPFGKAPYTAVFKTDVNDIPSGNIVLNFSDPFETDLKFTEYPLSGEIKSVSHTYMIPGVYHPHLKVNNKTLDSIDLPVYSNGWEWVVVNYHEKNPTFYTIKDDPSFRKNGVFCVPSTVVASYKVDTTTGYCMRYMNYQNFQVGAEDMQFNFKARNPVLSTKKCSNIELQLKFLHWNVGFMLFHQGCNGNYSRVQLGSKVLNGIENDLSMFEVDFNEWQNVVVKIKNHTAYIFVNDRLILESKIVGNIGSFQGISINAQESAQIDYLYLTTSEKTLLKEDF
jgi:hypothetical protein